MHQVYLILRNNIEKGPYSLKELLQLRLQPQDLIWIEGKSTSWSYPSEIEELRSYGDLSEKEAQARVAATDVIAIPPNRAESPPDRYLSPDGESPSQAAVDEEKQPTAESLEKKADEIYQRVLAYNRQKEQAGESKEINPAPIPQKVRPAEPAHVLPQKKKKQILSYKIGLLAGAGIIGIIAAKLFIGLQSTPVEKTAAPPPDQYVAPANYSEKAEVLPPKQEQPQPAPVVKEPLPDTAVPVTPVKKELSVDEFIDSVEQVLAKQDRLLAEKVKPKKSKKK